MSSWTDPDIRNHVKGSPEIMLSKLLRIMIFKENPEKIVGNYIKKRNGYLHNIKIPHPSLGALNDIKPLLKENVTVETIPSSHEYRLMKKAYLIYQRCYLYQILLLSNDMWNMYCYNHSYKNKINIPKDEHLIKTYEAYISLKAAHNVNEIKKGNEDEINSAIYKFSFSSDPEFTDTNLFQEKTYIDQYQLEKRMSSPLFGTYVKNQINQINKDDKADENIKRFISYVNTYEKESVKGDE